MLDEMRELRDRARIPGLLCHKAVAVLQKRHVRGWAYAAVCACHSQGTESGTKPRRSSMGDGQTLHVRKPQAH